jgi:hypothetical protein
MHRGGWYARIDIAAVIAIPEGLMADRIEHAPIELVEIGKLLHSARWNPLTIAAPQDFVVVGATKYDAFYEVGAMIVTRREQYQAKHVRGVGPVLIRLAMELMQHGAEIAKRDRRQGWL